ncbi:gamma-glutamyl-gamma-aminobutyrate hydrolase family protein [Marinactinospora thermotolerans]|uniref:gamma-glutamyl-gamma-aminobutyrate hydrolase family protein n=1 Tax=Marinactinospora thermotolerans TaxID=531310 RepID=UPI003D924F8A
MPRPLIGITGHLEAARWGDWVREAAVVAAPWLRAVGRAGGLPVAIPPTPPSGVGDLVERFDGFILTEGAHVDPAEYGEPPHPRTQDPDSRRDRFELALARALIRARRPFLAVARGAQVLNVAAGGSLLQYLPETLGHHEHAPTTGRPASTDISVSVTSRLGRVLGDRATVLESHTQGFNRIAPGLSPVAWAADGTVEAVEVVGHPFGIGVLWHPHEGKDPRLFQALTAEAAGPA